MYVYAQRREILRSAHLNLSLQKMRKRETSFPTEECSPVSNLTDELLSFGGRFCYIMELVMLRSRSTVDEMAHNFWALDEMAYRKNMSHFVRMKWLTETLPGSCFLGAGRNGSWYSYFSRGDNSYIT